VWGGLWGVLFFIPILKNRPLSKGLVLSLGSTLVQLLVVFTVKAKQGMMGLELGMLTRICGIV
jgi:hypothetical protein